MKEEEQKAADYRPGFHRGPGPRQAGRGGLQWPFCQELFPSAFWLYQRGRLSEGKAEAGERPFCRRHAGIYQTAGGALPPLVPALLAASDAAFANPETYEYCEEHRMTYFIRLPSNKNLDRLVAPHLGRPVGRPPQSGIQVKIVDLHYQAKTWGRPRRVVAKIEWHWEELFPRIGFVVTSSRLPAAKGPRSIMAGPR